MEVTIETDRILVIKRRKSSVLAWCPKCFQQVPMVAPDEAAVMIHVSSRKIYRWIEADKLHFTETSEGMLLICFNSLAMLAPLLLRNHDENAHKSQIPLNSET